MVDYITYDIETTSLDIDTAEIVCIGVYTSWDSKTHCIWKKDIHLFRQMVQRAEFIIGFNNEEYDNPVMMNRVNRVFHTEDVFKYKTIDLYKVVKLKSAMFKVKFNKYSLDHICEKLNLSRKQSGFDYKILQKPVHTMTNKEVKYIEDYTKQDIKSTNDLYLYVDKLFSAFNRYLPEKDIKRKSALRSQSGGIANKVICHVAGIKEEYTETNEKPKYPGGYVMMPVVDSSIGKIHVVDLASSYPHAFMSANLYTHCKHCRDNCNKVYTGGTAFGTELKLNGEYCTRWGMGKIEKALKELYADRIEAKKLAKTDPFYDNLQLALKIVINTAYGITGSPKFKNLYNVNTASDCTMIGRYFIKMLKKHMASCGYIPLYVDTDSLFMIDPFDDTKKMMGHVDDYVVELMSIFPFPQSTFDVELEESMQYIQFFRDQKTDKFVKKRYLYLTNENKVTVKGLAVIRGDSSLVSRDIWKNRLIPHIIENKSCRISINKMKSWVDSALAENISQAAVEFKVREYDSYRHNSQIQAQISKVLGEGTHMLVKTFRNYGIGLSKGSRYCTIEQAISDGIGAFNMKRINSDLSPFVMDELVKLDGFEVCEEKKDMFDF